jgi:hypothetical protein
MEVLGTYLIDNLVFFVITVLTLLVWNFTDLYIELKIFSFVRRKEFWVYYLVGAFFSIIAMEGGFILGLFEIDNKGIIAVIAPLAFSIILGNLVVKVGGVDNSVNFSEFFDKFRFAIKDSLNIKKEMDRVKLQTRLLDSDVDSEKILEWCRFYSKDEEIAALVKKTEKMEPRNGKIELIKFLVGKANTAEITNTLEQQIPKK